MQDWLDNPEVKFMGLFPFLVASIAFTLGLLITPTPATASFEFRLTCALISYMLLSIALYYFFTERKVIEIKTSLSQEENYRLTIDILSTLNWDIQQKQKHFITAWIPFIFNKPGQFLTVIIIEGAIYINIRNIGSSKGRLPFFFGLDRLKEKTFIKTLKSATNIG